MYFYTGNDEGIWAYGRMKFIRQNGKSKKYTEKRHDKNTSTARIITILINALSRVTCKEEGI